MQEYLGPEIISHFVMHGASVTEIVKLMINEIRKKEDDVPNMFLEAMKRVDILKCFRELRILCSILRYIIFNSSRV